MFIMIMSKSDSVTILPENVQLIEVVATNDTVENITSTEAIILADAVLDQNFHDTSFLNSPSVIRNIFFIALALLIADIIVIIVLVNM